MVWKTGLAKTEADSSVAIDSSMHHGISSNVRHLIGFIAMPQSSPPTSPAERASAGKYLANIPVAARWHSKT